MKHLDPTHVGDGSLDSKFRESVSPVHMGMARRNLRLVRTFRISYTYIGLI